MRTTKQDVIRQFELFCKLYNLHTSAQIVKDNPEYKGQFYSNEFIKLDYNPHYGGYRLDVVEVGTGERFFTDMSRKSAKEMLCYLNGLISAKNETNFRGIVKS